MEKRLITGASSAALDVATSLFEQRARKIEIHKEIIYTVTSQKARPLKNRAPLHGGEEIMHAIKEVG
jgi:hypothetical protein